MKIGNYRIGIKETRKKANPKCNNCQKEARWNHIIGEGDEYFYCDECKENIVLEQISDLFLEFELIE